MRSPYGLTLIELVVVLAVLGVFLALGVPRLNPDPQAVNQAAQGLAQQVTRARFEAIRRNELVGLWLQIGGAGGFALFVDANRNGSYDAGEPIIHRVTFGAGDWGRVRLQSVSGSSTLVFDTRGIPRDWVQTTVTLSNRAGTYTRNVQISPQGRAQVAQP
jgi:type IV fimbrial biogenesis protein FimT